jgi:hypothetical protein
VVTLVDVVTPVRVVTRFDVAAGVVVVSRGENTAARAMPASASTPA